jgi:hypothetical protein
VSIDISHEASETPSFPENFGHWSKRAELGATDIKIVPVVDSKERSQIALCFTEAIENARRKGEKVPGYVPDHYFKQTPRIVEIKRIEDPVSLRCFEARVEKTRLLNAKRPEQKRFQGSPVAVRFHGTSLHGANSIMETGFNIEWSRQGLYGRGIYCSSDPRVARAHCTPDSKGLFYMLCCRANEGRKQAKDDSIGDYDSKGVGDSITVVPADSDIYAEYLLVIDDLDMALSSGSSTGSPVPAGSSGGSSARSSVSGGSPGAISGGSPGAISPAGLVASVGPRPAKRARSPPQGVP